jgi:hypothetical protein
LSDAKSGELLRSVVLVESIVGVLLEFLHVCSDQHLAQLDEIAVLLIVDFNDTPWVFASADLATICTRDLRVGTHDSKGDLRHDLVVLGNRLIIIKLVSGTLEYLDVMMFDISKNLKMLASTQICRIVKHTLALKAMISSSVIVSALAITGIKLTLVCSLRMTSMSSGFKAWPVG